MENDAAKQSQYEEIHVLHICIFVKSVQCGKGKGVLRAALKTPVKPCKGLVKPNQRFFITMASTEKRPGPSSQIAT